MEYIVRGKARGEGRGGDLASEDRHMPWTNFILESCMLFAPLAKPLLMMTGEGNRHFNQSTFPL